MTWAGFVHDDPFQLPMQPWGAPADCVLPSDVRSNHSNAPEEGFQHTMTILELATLLCGLLTLCCLGTHWTYHCRVGLVALIGLAALPVLARSAFKSLAIGAFDLSTISEGFEVGLVLFLVAWAVVSTSDLVLGAGAERMPRPAPKRRKPAQVARTCTVLLALALNFKTILYASKDTRLAAGLGVTCGLLAGLLLFAIARRLRPARSKVSIRPFKIKMPDWLGRGYLEQAPDGTCHLRPDHVTAMVALVVTTAVYYLFDVLRLVENLTLPPLCYVFLLATVLVWLFGGIAFFFDAYLVPVLLPLIAWIALWARLPRADHYYPLPLLPLTQTAVTAGTSSGEVLAYAKQRGGPIVLVSAAGGGIQAAAWTERVLEGLSAKLEDFGPNAFARSICLLSGVSGGSTGLMYYLHGTYPLADGQPLQRDRAQALIEAAEASSLGSAVRGLAYADILRAIAPFFVVDIYDDRARGLQEAWVRNGDKLLGGTSLGRATLRNWQVDLANKVRPALILNATAVETGQRITFSTSFFSDGHLAQGQADFETLYPDRDIKIATAARLSATFPFISPAARPRAEGGVLHDQQGEENLHLVDGGYFDNSGIVALANWLDDGLKDDVATRPGLVPQDILVIIIMPFPETKQGSIPSHSGAYFQTLAPLQTLWTVRNQVQAGFSQRDLSMLIKRWELEPRHRVKIVSVPIYFPSIGKDDPPLSWHLRHPDVRKIEEAWATVARGKSVGDVVTFFKEHQPAAHR